MLEFIIVSALASVFTLYIIYLLGKRISNLTRMILFYVLMLVSFCLFYWAIDTLLFASVESGWLRFDLWGLFDREPDPTKQWRSMRI